MTFEASDQFDTMLSDGLRQRAAAAGRPSRGFSDVRRRYRRRRQQQIAVGLVPAVAGLGWVITRPRADAPLQPTGGGLIDCGDPTVPTWSDPTWPAVSTTSPLVWVPDTGVATTDGPNSTPEPTVRLGWRDPAGGLLIVNASQRAGVEDDLARLFPGAITTTSSIKIDLTELVAVENPVDSDRLVAEQVAQVLGLARVVQGSPGPGFVASLDHGGSELLGVSVMVVIGNDTAGNIPTLVAAAQAVPSTTAPIESAVTTTTVCVPTTEANETTVPGEANWPFAEDLSGLCDDLYVGALATTTTTGPAPWAIGKCAEVVFVDATAGTGVAATYANHFRPGAQVAQSPNSVEQSYLMFAPGYGDVAGSIAEALGIVVPDTGEPYVVDAPLEDLVAFNTEEFPSVVRVAVVLGTDALQVLGGSSSTGDSTTTTSILFGDFVSTKVQVANCSIQNGVARMMSTALSDAGFTTVDAASGMCDPKLDNSYVIYDASVPGAQAVAETVARMLGGLHSEPAVLPIKTESGAWADGSGVVVLLGNDLAGLTLDQITHPTTTIAQP